MVTGEGTWTKGPFVEKTFLSPSCRAAPRRRRAAVVQRKHLQKVRGKCLARLYSRTKLYFCNSLTAAQDSWIKKRNIKTAAQGSNACSVISFFFPLTTKVRDEISHVARLCLARVCSFSKRPIYIYIYLYLLEMQGSYDYITSDVRCRRNELCARKCVENGKTRISTRDNDDIVVGERDACRKSVYCVLIRYLKPTFPSTPLTRLPILELQTSII